MGRRGKQAAKLKEEEEEFEVGEEEDYVVEKIVDQRTRDGRLEYFLKWKGYSSLENTWEPAENLDCPELLEEFKKSQKRANEDLSSSESETRKRKVDENSNRSHKTWVLFATKWLWLLLYCGIASE